MKKPRSRTRAAPLKGHTHRPQSGRPAFAGEHVPPADGIARPPEWRRRVRPGAGHPPGPSAAAPGTAATWRPSWWAGWLLVPISAVGCVAALDLWCGRAPGRPELVLILTVVGLLALGVVSLRSQALGPAFCGPRPGPAKVVALTFDDGPDPRTTPRILAALGAQRATFFVIGEKARAHPELIADMSALGHMIAAHGERHSWQAMMTVAGARALIADGIRSLRALGVATGPFFRPPYGLMTPPLHVAARAQGLTLVGWSRRSWDTFGWWSAERFARQLAARVKNGDIVLLHDAPQARSKRQPLGIAAIGTLVSELQARGFEFLTVEELFRHEDTVGQTPGAPVNHPRPAALPIAGAAGVGLSGGGGRSPA